MTDTPDSGGLTVVPPKPKDKLSRRGTKNFTRARSDTIFRRLEAQTSHADLCEALAHAGTEKARQLLAYLLDPAFATHSLPKLAERVGMRYAEVLDVIRRSKLDVAVLTAASHAPAIIDDAATDARGRTVKCWECAGEGETTTTIPPTSDDEDAEPEVVTRGCKNCQGSGKVRIAGDPDARKLVLEAAGLVGKRGPMVAIQTNIGGGIPTVEDDMEKVSNVIDGQATPSTEGDG